MDVQFQQGPILEFDEYESIPTSSVTAHMLAGAFAGIMEHCVMYPLDSVKTRMQSLQPEAGGAYRNVGEALVRMVQNEGIFRPVRGMSVVVAGAGPAHAAYFACYEKIKESLVLKAPSHYNHLAYGVAGSVATVLHDGVMTPADVVKQRMQMYKSPYASVWACIRTVYATEGLRAFYRSYVTQLTMNVPFQSIHFMVYESMQGVTNEGRQYNPKAHMLSGAMAGAIAAAVTTPLDVCKTLLNTQESTALSSLRQTRIRGLSHAFRTVYHLGGVRGYFQGATARVLYQIPSTAICWSVYEFLKYVIKSN